MDIRLEILPRGGQAKELRQKDNEWSNKYFAISIGAMMAITVVFHWISLICFQYGRGKDNAFMSRLATYQRKFQCLLSRRIVGTSIDRIILYGLYWSINLILVLTNVELTSLTYVAKRFGWITLANFVLLVFLALRNTPLAPLSANSYEKLRPLHKVAGYTCIFASGNLQSMLETEQIAGVVAGIAMLIIAASTVPFVYRGYYEVFYLTHLVMFLLILITAAMHRPKFSKSAVIIIIFTACLWSTDRLIRFLKICWNFPGNHATLTALPDGAIRVRLSRPVRATAGSHSFLWIPAIRLVETHPFTMLATDPPEFIIRVHDGFTRDLWRYASKTSGEHEKEKKLRCSIDGGYGQVLDFKKFDRVVLIAGGSGASFTFAVAMDLIRKESGVKCIDFIWVVRSKDALSWYDDELRQLQPDPRVNLRIYVTRSAMAMEQAEIHPLSSPDVSDSDPSSPIAEFTIYDVEKGGAPGTTSEKLPSPISLHQGRPQISDLITDIVSNTGSNDCIAIGACGPSNLVDRAREAIRKHGYDNGPSITLYSEEFRW
ncbi:hypothetical protein PVAR5_1436 [Paecilomyces variotii No. 5]|uniref:FAD-binding FR-type domain-containing protein n=1 Tax=Byssochlamys spectabilis (strain No. 5 / NBRC 109023) TaxID=1356009 RepID=V5HTJ0_BYSSN|nr:hypothetical protein PVAR5_1436 [Paecilomyces variotii No. 5]